MNKPYTAIIDAVEDLEGTGAYIIGSENPLSETLVDKLQSDYISINLLEILSKIYGFTFEEAIDDES